MCRSVLTYIFALKDIAKIPPPPKKNKKIIIFSKDVY
jgi:hypothetical protein